MNDDQNNIELNMISMGAFVVGFIASVILSLIGWQHGLKIISNLVGIGAIGAVFCIAEMIVVSKYNRTFPCIGLPPLGLGIGASLVMIYHVREKPEAVIFSVVIAILLVICSIVYYYWGRK